MATRRASLGISKAAPNGRRLGISEELVDGVEVGLSQSMLQAGLGIAGLNAMMVHHGASHGAGASSARASSSFFADDVAACGPLGLLGRNPSTTMQDPLHHIFMKHGGDVVARSRTLKAAGELDRCKALFLQATEDFLLACREGDASGSGPGLPLLTRALTALHVGGCCSKCGHEST